MKFLKFKLAAIKFLAVIFAMYVNTVLFYNAVEYLNIPKFKVFFYVLSVFMMAIPALFAFCGSMSIDIPFRLACRRLYLNNLLMLMFIGNAIVFTNGIAMGSGFDYVAGGQIMLYWSAFILVARYTAKHIFKMIEKSYSDISGANMVALIRADKGLTQP